LTRRTDRGLAILIGLSALIAGCGGSNASSRAQSSRGLALERTQLAQVSSELGGLEGPVGREVAASREAWPLIADGLPRALPSSLRATVRAASARASALPEPSFLANASKLTGPAAGIAGIYENYEQLSRRGWSLTDAAIQTITSVGSDRTKASAGEAGAGTNVTTVGRRATTGPGAGTGAEAEAATRPGVGTGAGTDVTTAGAGAEAEAAGANASAAQASFERMNSPLYIDAIYDAHFDLSLLGKSLVSGYEKLGGRAAFGAALTQGQVEALARAYSIPAVRLEPHPAGAAKEG
jgi:hypothetical protein